MFDTHHQAEIIVKEFEAGRMSRRELIAQLTGIGAAAAGFGMPSMPSSAAAAQVTQSSRRAEPTFTARSVDHIALSVTDVPRSRDWYVKHLGLRVTRDGPSSCFLDVGEHDFLALFKADKPGLHHFSFGISNYDQDDAARRLREAGLEPRLRGRRTYFDDPDGLEVQVSAQR